MGQIIWLGISIALAVVGGIVLYFTFLKRSNNEKFEGFLGWMYDFLTFKKIFIEDFLKILYLVSAIFTTLVSFVFISKSFFHFLGILIGGNIVLRVTFELTLIMLLLCRNISDINGKFTRLNAHLIPEKEEKAETKKEKKESKKEESKEEVKE